MADKGLGELVRAYWSSVLGLSASPSDKRVTIILFMYIGRLLVATAVDECHMFVSGHVKQPDGFFPMMRRMLSLAG